MKIIRDNEFFGLAMIPLLVDWGIRRCNYEGCRNKPNTIITEVEGTPIFGLCEEHFQMCNVPSGGTLALEWGDFDAFKEER